MSPVIPGLFHLASLAALPIILDNPPALPVVAPLPVIVAVAEEDGAPVQTTEWLDEQFAEARRLYNHFGIYFQKPAVRKLDARFKALETKADRDALADELQKGKINVFVVATLRDVHDPKLYRMGVHWAPNGDLKRQYVIVAASARKTTTAHEIGHFFKLQHTTTPDNLMSYSRTGGVVFLTAAQKATVLSAAKQYVSRKELLP